MLPAPLIQNPKRWNQFVSDVSFSHLWRQGFSPQKCTCCKTFPTLFSVHRGLLIIVCKSNIKGERYKRKRSNINASDVTSLQSMWAWNLHARLPMQTKPSCVQLSSDFGLSHDGWFEMMRSCSSLSQVQWGAMVPLAQISVRLCSSVKFRLPRKRIHTLVQHEAISL
jgi:hypothetical protein